MLQEHKLRKIMTKANVDREQCVFYHFSGKKTPKTENKCTGCPVLASVAVTGRTPILAVPAFCAERSEAGKPVSLPRYLFYKLQSDNLLLAADTR